MTIDSTEYIRTMADRMYQNQQANNPHLEPISRNEANRQVSIDFEAGRMLWGPIRNSVGILKQKGWTISLWEGEGWLSRPFIIKGESGAINQIISWLERLEAEK